MVLREQAGRGVSGCEHLSTQIHQKYNFRHRSACTTPAESRQEYLISRKECIELCKLHRMMELEGKTGVLIGLDLPSAGGRTEAGVQSPHHGNCLNQRRNI